MNVLFIDTSETRRKPREPAVIGSNWSKTIDINRVNIYSYSL